MTQDPALAGLMRRFATLSREERDYVLGLLGQAEREALRLALSETTGTALSHGFAALVDSCRAGEAPAGITKRAAAALLAAVDAATDHDPIDLALRPLPPRSRGWNRFLGREAPAA